MTKSEYPDWDDGYVDTGHWMKSGHYWVRCSGGPLSWIRMEPRSSLVAARCYGEGYDLGRKAELGDDLPHPSCWPFPENFYHGLRAALGGRGLDISVFMRVIEKNNAI